MTDKISDGTDGKIISYIDRPISEDRRVRAKNRTAANSFGSTDGDGGGYWDSVIDVKYKRVYPFPIFSVLSLPIDCLYGFIVPRPRARRSVLRCGERETRWPFCCGCERETTQTRSGERGAAIYNYYYFVGHRRCDLYIEMYFNLNGKQMKIVPKKKLVLSVLHPHLVPISVAFGRVRGWLISMISILLGVTLLYARNVHVLLIISLLISSDRWFTRLLA